MDQTPKHNESGIAALQGGGIGGSVALVLTYFLPKYSDLWIPLGALITVAWGYFLQYRHADTQKPAEDPNNAPK